MKITSQTRRDATKGQAIRLDGLKGFVVHALRVRRPFPKKGRLDAKVPTTGGATVHTHRHVKDDRIFQMGVKCFAGDIPAATGFLSALRTGCDGHAGV